MDNGSRPGGCSVFPRTNGDTELVDLTAEYVLEPDRFTGRLGKCYRNLE